MGLLSRRTTTTTSFRSASFILRFIVVLFFLVFAIVLLFEVDSFVSQSKTIEGRNLEPPPWHLFEPKTFHEEGKYSKASKIIQCNYLSCAIDTTTVEVSSRHLNSSDSSRQAPYSCPDFFKSIYSDLEPWAKTKISMAHVMGAQKFASFRVVIISGRMYVDFYYACVQSRAMFTIWGILQLLKRYPGKVPDVDLMFECMDKPTIDQKKHSSMPLPLFRYCTTPGHFDIPFPDWSFWGWSEINIGPWDLEFKSIKEASEALSWEDRLPFAYWKGNPDVGAPIREQLLQCDGIDMWGAQILRQNWGEEAKAGFKESKLSKQCKHRYKIYAEGYAWSVSLKYILSCGSVPLIISPQYQDFFSRGLAPMKNYWLVPRDGLCERIKAAVNFGNAHVPWATAVGKGAQDLMETLSMDRVYDYMYHLLVEYSKLQDFTPTRPPSAVEVCSKSVLCFADDRQKQFLRQSAAGPSLSPPCALHRPHKRR